MDLLCIAVKEDLSKPDGPTLAAGSDEGGASGGSRGLDQAADQQLRALRAGSMSVCCVCVCVCFGCLDFA